MSIEERDANCTIALFMGHPGLREVAIFKFAQRCYGLAAVLIWNDFNFEPPFHDIETEIVITYFNLRFAGPNFRRADPVLSYELFKDRDLIFLISEPPVSWILTSIFNKKIVAQ